MLDGHGLCGLRSYGLDSDGLLVLFDIDTPVSDLHNYGLYRHDVYSYGVYSYGL